MTAKQDRVETDTYVALQGNIPSDCYLGQLVRIGYSKEGLYQDTNQSVEVDYMVKGNLLMNVILPGLKLTAHSVADDLKIISRV